MNRSHAVAVRSAEAYVRDLLTERELTDDELRTAEEAIGLAEMTLLDLLVEQSSGSDPELESLLAEAESLVGARVSAAYRHLVDAIIRTQGAGRAAPEGEPRVAEPDHPEGEPMRYMGVWRSDRAYVSGQAVTCGGTLWFCRGAVAEGERPGTTEGWQLMVKTNPSRAPKARTK